MQVNEPADDKEIVSASFARQGFGTSAPRSDRMMSTSSSTPFVFQESPNLKGRGQIKAPGLGPSGTTLKGVWDGKNKNKKPSTFSFPAAEDPDF